MIDSLSVVLPAYNEEANIEAAVTQALAALPSIARQFEVIVVNDGSSDGTGKVGEELARRHYPNVRLLNHVKNQGYGAALRTGFAYSRYSYVFFTDSDNQFDISELKFFVPLMSQYDIVTGFRVYRYDSVLRCMVSWIYNRIAGVLFRLRVRDVDCAFKLCRREVVEKITIECNNFFASTELLARARKWNFRIAEKGVRHYPRVAGETTVRASDIPRTLREIARMWRRIYFPNRKALREMNMARKHDANVVEFLPTGS
ncbi:MAG TPA: glycosyltransferase family 2 protein [Chloroflexia bacterium]|jgi:dolichol-phosphate mannosyltransferase